MRGICCWFVVLAACAGNDVDDGKTDPAVDMSEMGDTDGTGDTEVVPVLPPGCDASLSLHGMAPQGPVVVGPQMFDGAGFVVCLELDARDNIHVAHFAAGTQYEQAVASSFELALFADDGTLLRDGWDVTFGNGNAFANVEYGIAERELITARLLVRAKSAATHGEVRLHLFEPYE